MTELNIEQKGVTIKVSGPLFKYGGEPIASAIRDSVHELTAEGERLAKDRAIEVVYSHGGAHPNRYKPTGRWLNSIHGDVVGEMGTLSDSKLVYGPWLEGVSSRNETTRFKGYATFRWVFGKLEDMKAGIVEKHIRRAVEKLNGTG